MSARGPLLLPLAACLLAGVAVGCTPRSTDDPGAPGAAGDTLRQVELYFPGDDGRLHGEAREIPDHERPEAAIAVMVEELLVGPQGETLWPPLERLPPADDDDSTAGAEPDTDAAEDPEDVTVAEDAKVAENTKVEPPAEGVRLGSVYLLGGDTVVVDFEAPAGPPAVGARQEELMLYSLVNSLLLNTPQSSRMIVLWNGEQPLTFAGHIDTTRPLRYNCALIAPPRPAACDGLG